MPIFLQLIVEVIFFYFDFETDFLWSFDTDFCKLLRLFSFLKEEVLAI